MTLPALRASPTESVAINLEDYTKAMLNILEDFAAEKGCLEGTQRAALNIMEDFASEKGRLEEAQRAMLNLLDDFSMERERTEAANRELREAIDSLHRAKEAADAANRELESFAYSVSHDLRSPLRAIDSFSRFLADDYGNRLDAEGHRLLGIVRSNTIKMGQLIDDLLAFSRLGRQGIKMAPIDTRRLAEEVFTELQADSPGRAIQFRPGKLLPARGDPSMIRQVFTNLLSNAVKFTRSRETAVIEMDSWMEGQETVYSIKDNGVGFDMQYVSKLFGVFQRLHPAEEFEGTGVGLAIVERIIQRHGGRVWAEGKVKEGATFYFSLPTK